MQTVSSMNTSINVAKLPAIWNKMRIPRDGTYWLVDYGAGRYETSQNIIRYLTHTSSVSKTDRRIYLMTPIGVVTR